MEDAVVYIDASDGIEHLISRMEGQNRWDKLKIIDQHIKALITNESQKEQAAVKERRAQLKAEEAMLRERQIDLNRKTWKPRAPRKPRATKVTPAPKIKVTAKGTGTVSSSAA